MHVRSDPGEVERVRGLFKGVSRDADVLLLAGDLTDHGRAGEAETLLRALDGVGVPVLAVLGNHDHESGSAQDVARVLSMGGIECLDGRATVLDGVGFAGVKGFCGGFAPHLVRAFGEDALKAFVSESVVEAEALRNTLRSLTTSVKVALLHYSPIVETLGSEPAEIHAFLGSDRLASAIDEGGAALALHGHAHRGALHGRTPGGVRVCNVSLPVLRATGNDPYLVLTV